MAILSPFFCVSQVQGHLTASISEPAVRVSSGSSYFRNDIPIINCVKEDEIDIKKIIFNYSSIDFRSLDRPIDQLTIIKTQSKEIVFDINYPQDILILDFLKEGSYTVFFRRGKHLVSIQLYRS